MSEDMNGSDPTVRGSSRLEDLRRDYRVAFLRYLSSRDEAALAVAYEKGRAAVAGGVGILDVVHLHHELLAQALADVPSAEMPGVVGAAGDVLGEVLAWAEMSRRALGAPDAEPDPGSRADEAAGKHAVERENAHDGDHDASRRG